MATRTCLTGSYVLDAAGFVSLQAVRNAVAHPNCDGLSLYNGARYGCTIEHVKIVIDSGKCVGPNWERRADEAMYGSGAWAVDSARAGVEKWGIDPSTVPTILSAVDFGPTAAQYAQLDYWHETACDRADETNTWIGFYGATAYGNHLIQQPWWQRAGNRPTWTWGGNGMIAGTNMKQHYGFPSGIDWSSVGVTVDESRVEAGLAMYAAEGDPLEPQEVDVEFKIYQCVDADAAFLGLTNADGIAPWIEWLSGARKAHFLADGIREKETSVAGLANCTLIGAIPQGDSRHNWSAGDFAQTSSAGPKGDPGKDAPIPKSFTPVY